MVICFQQVSGDLNNLSNNAESVVSCKTRCSAGRVRAGVHYTGRDTHSERQIENGEYEGERGLTVGRCRSVRHILLGWESWLIRLLCVEIKESCKV